MIISMKKLLFISFFSIVTLVSLAQKTDKNALIPSVPYDSTANFLGKNVAQYLGQELWLKGMPKRQQEFGYSNFILKYKKDDGVMNDTKNIYKCCDGYNSKYSELADKHFLVIEVIEHPKAHKDTIGYSDNYYLKLREKESGDIVYYKYETNSEFTFPFIVMGFLEKQKELQIGKEYVFPNDVLAGAKDVKTQNPVSIQIGQQWKCVDVNVDNKDYELSLFVQNAKGQIITVPFSVIQNNQLPRKAYTKDEAFALRKRVGINSYNRILQQKIGMNMTPEMCRLSWGDPLEIKAEGSGKNKTEVWLYSGNSLTFKNGKLIKIN